GAIEVAEGERDDCRVRRCIGLWDPHDYGPTEAVVLDNGHAAGRIEDSDGQLQPAVKDTRRVEGCRSASVLVGVHRGCKLRKRRVVINGDTRGRGACAPCQCYIAELVVVKMEYVLPPNRGCRWRIRRYLCCGIFVHAVQWRHAFEVSLDIC